MWKDYFDADVADCEPLIVHRSGKESVVVIIIGRIQCHTQTKYLTSSPVMVGRIEQAEKDIEEGKGKKINLEDLWE